ncbi:MAG: methyltransferase domain-containing protein [Anaerolineales bacterium]|nr:methyltransferase domain-containing protein [Anaerolineales bacterium]MCB9127412.1 methyltransferase domain-containing protein [Ardenticatenales bacterium]
MDDNHPTINFEIRLPESLEPRASYDAIYNQRAIQQLDSFYLWLLRQLSPVSGMRLLDVASGAGRLGHFAQQRYGVRVIGSDLSVCALRMAADNHPSSHYIAANGEALPFCRGAFDYVTCIGSLEHFADMASGIKEIGRVVKKSGIICLLLPNTYSLMHNVYKAYKEGTSVVDQQPLQRYAARLEWAQLLRRNGLTVTRVVKYERERPLTVHDAAWYLRHRKSLARLIVAPLVPFNLAHSFVYFCRVSSL